jgi:hypothetical protein
MRGLDPRIHLQKSSFKLDGRVIGEPSDAVLRTAMPGHDAERAERENEKWKN